MNRVAAAACALLLLPAASPRALPALEFEARPTSATDVCSAPCYQVRMFIEDPFDELEILNFQLDIFIGQGAVPAIYAIPPEQNGNTGSANIRVLTSTGNENFPWSLSSTVGGTAAASDALMVHAADEFFSVRSLAAELDSDSTTCIDDPEKCALLAAALAGNRLYLGFFNATLGEALVGDGSGDGGCLEPFHGRYCGPPPLGAYFVIRSEQIYGSVRITPSTGGGTLTGDAALNVLFNPDGQPPQFYVPLLPEASPARLLAGVFALLAALRRPSLREQERQLSA